MAELLSPVDRPVDPVDPPPATTRYAQFARAARRIGIVVRANWLFLIVFGLGTVGRVLTMIAYSPALLYIDSYRYLGKVYSLNAQSSDPIGYPVFLRLVLWTGNLGVVVAIQHLLGLGMGVCVYVILRRRNAPKWLAALASAPVLLDAYQWQIEQNILSDSLFLAMVTAALTVLAWRRSPGPRLAAAAGLILGLAITVRLVGEVTIIPALLFAALAAGPTWKRKLQVGAFLVLGFAVPVGGYVLYAHNVSGAGYTQAESDNALLYGRAATFADCASLPAEYRSMCPTGSIAAREAMGPDYYANAAPYPVNQALEHPFARYVIEHQPGDFAYAVGRDFLQLFISPRQTVYGGTDITRWQFQPDYPTWSSDKNQATEEFRAFGESGPSVNLGVARVLIDYQRNGGYAPGYLYAAFLLAGVGGTLGADRLLRRGRRPGGKPAGTKISARCSWNRLSHSARDARRLRREAGLWTLTGLGLLLLADVFEFSWRYQLPALVLLPAGGALGLCALLGRGHRPGPDEAEDEPAGRLPGFRPDPAGHEGEGA